MSKKADSEMDPATMAEIESLCAAPFVNPSQANADRPTFSTVATATSGSAAPPSTRQNLAVRGAELFAQDCAGCHGSAGDGAGRAAAGLLPRPANLRASRYATPGLASTLWNGVVGSSMPAWRDLPAADLASLVTHVQALHTPPRDAGILASTSTLARGATVYAANCVSCHGTNGDGRGPVAKVLLPHPADLTRKQPDASLVQRVLNEGVPGTAMPPWPGMSGADRQAVTAFVRSLYMLPAGATQ
jgi:mono/diheme cytochrome c family protein